MAAVDHKEKTTPDSGAKRFPGRRTKTRLPLLVVAPLLLLATPGCMLMHFMGDHHSGMGSSGHGERDGGHGGSDPRHGGDRGGDHGRPAGDLDREFHRDTQGGVTVEAQFTEGREKGELAFRLTLDSHSVNVGPYMMQALSFLGNDRGAEVPSSRWEVLSGSSHQLSGTIYFPGQDHFGQALLVPGVQKVFLRIRGLAGVSERTLSWSVSSPAPRRMGFRMCEGEFFRDCFVVGGRPWDV